MRIYLKLQFIPLLCCVSIFLVGTCAQDSVLGQENPVDYSKLQFPGIGLVNPDPPFLSGVLLDHSDGVYQDGELLNIGFQAERDVQAKREVRLYLLYHQADGTTLLLFPNSVRPNNLIPRGKTVFVPDDPGAYRFRIRGPFGVECLQVLAADTPIQPLDQLAQSSRGRAALVAPATLQSLEKSLARDPDLWSEHHAFLRTTAKRPSPEPRKTSRVGLFIGIGEYKNPQYVATHSQLRHSAEVMHDAMLKRGGLAADRTKLLIDKQATRKAMEDHIFRWLPSVTEPGDTVFIYFSGHAGQDDNHDGTEPDGQDEILAPYDYDHGSSDLSQRERDQIYAQTSIRDDTMARWLQALQGRRVVLILDTCMSGGFSEGKSVQGFFDGESARVKDISQLNTVVLTATGADEQALFNGTPNDTMWFTYFLSQAIEKHDALTVHEGFEYARLGVVEALKKMQEVRRQEPTLTDNALIPIALVP